MPTVLVVDDSETDRRVAGGMIEKACDVNVCYAEDGKQALAQIDRHRPDLVITDMQMVEMNGLQLVAAIKSDFPRIPVILMTAKGSEELAAEALQQGAACYVPKNLLAKHLTDTVLRVLAASKQDRKHSHLMHHLTADDCTFVFHNDLGLIQELVVHLQELLRCLPLGDEIERLRMGIAVEEALKNAYYHGNLEVGATVGRVDHQAYAELAAQRRFEEPFRERRIHLRARISRDEAVFVVRDEGPGFDASQLAGMVDFVDDERSAGRGTRLMHAIMDEVTYNTAGNEVTLTKRRAAELDADDEAGD